VEEGITAAVWAVDYAIEVGAPLVGKGIDAYSLGSDGKRIKARQLTPEELTEHRAFIQAARDKMRELLDLRKANAADAARIPTADRA
jgi:hypothetical protein